jgi:hypothetical protein
MSNSKFSSHVFLGKAELNRLKRFLDTDGFRKILLSNTVRFGIIYNKVDSAQAASFDDLRVEQGTNSGTIKVKKGVAVDKNGNLITKALEDNIAIPNNGNYYWIKIKHQYTNIEEGTISIDASGVMTGTGTKFTELFRGVPNFPTRIKFPDSVLNVLEYDVLEVTGDTSAQLNIASFVAENNLKYQVVGTFTPGQVPPSQDKNIFEYDSCIPTTLGVGIVQETILNTRPAFLQNEEFYIARVRNNSGTMIIEDKRNEIWQPKADFLLEEIVRVGGDRIAGIDSIQYDNERSDGTHNIVQMSWGVTANSWTINSSARIVSLLGFSGGRMKTTANFNNNDFDFHRLYLPSGEFVRILSSTKNGSQVDLLVDVLDPSKFVAVNGINSLIVVPDAEEVEFHFIPEYDYLELVTNNNLIDTAEMSNVKYTLPIADGTAKLRVPTWQTLDKNNVAHDASVYFVKVRFKTFKTYTPWANIIDVYNYYNEFAFDKWGLLVDTSKTTQIAGNAKISLNHKPGNYYDFVRSVSTGDLLGVYNRNLDNGNPVVQLIIGVERMYQHIFGSVTLSTDHVINLSTAGARNGNKFFINVDAAINKSSNRLIVTQGYVNPGNVGTVLFEFSEYHLSTEPTSQFKRVFLRCEFDGTNWIVFPHISLIPLTDKCEDIWKPLTMLLVQAQPAPGNTLYSSGAVNSTDPLTPQYRICQDGSIKLRGAIKLATYDVAWDRMGSTHHVSLAKIPDLNPSVGVYLPTVLVPKHIQVLMFYGNDTSSGYQLTTSADGSPNTYAVLKVMPDGTLEIYWQDVGNTSGAGESIYVMLDGIMIH